MGEINAACLLQDNRLVAEKEIEILHIKRAGGFSDAEHIEREARLALLQGANLLLDAVLDEEPVGHDLVSLTDAMSAIDGLRFHGGIPPRIEEHDIRRGHEIQTAA